MSATVEQIQQALPPIGTPITATITNAVGHVLVTDAVIYRPAIVETDDLPKNWEYGDTPAVAVGLKDFSNRFAIWPVDEVTVSESGVVTLAGPKGEVAIRVTTQEIADERGGFTT